MEEIMTDTQIKIEKPHDQPILLRLAEWAAKHPFMTSAAACLAATALTSAGQLRLLWLMVSVVAFMLCCLIGSSYISCHAEKGSRYRMMTLLSVISAVLTLVFLYFLSFVHKPQLLILNVGLLMLFAAAVYLFCKKRLDDKKAVLLIIIAGFLIRLAYIMTFTIQQKQHDVGSIEKMNGHLGYIAYFVYQAQLPDFDVRTVYQFYHPPLHHIIADVWVRIQLIFGMNVDNAFENVQILTLFYSTISMILSYKIFRQLGLKGGGMTAACAVAAFCPAFYILGGSINNDMLSITFMLGAILNTLYWYKSRHFGRLMCIAVCVGCAMMAKLSGWMVAPAIGFVFAYVFFKDRQNIKKYLWQYAAFLLVCAPLALWWEIRNNLRYDVPISYVLKLSEDSDQYIGNVPVLQRLFDFRAFQFENAGEQFVRFDGAYNEYNPLVGIFKTSMFDELFTVKYYPGIAGFDKILLWSAIIIALAGFAGMIYTFIFDKKLSFVHKTFLGILYFVFLLFYYIFCLTFPHVCTQNIRYAVPLIVLGAYFAGRAVQLMIGCKKEKCRIVCMTGGILLTAVIVMYSINSVVVYEKIFIG